MRYELRQSNSILWARSAYENRKYKTFPWGKGDRREAVVDEGQQNLFA